MLYINAGAGIYVDDSYYVNGAVVANNTLIVQKPGSCSYCKVDVFCYSNSTSSDVGYFTLSNGARHYSMRGSYDYVVVRQNPSGVRIYSYTTRTPDIWGIFTCELPDSEGNTVETSIGIYSSMPGMSISHKVNVTSLKDSLFQLQTKTFLLHDLPYFIPIIYIIYVVITCITIMKVHHLCTVASTLTGAATTAVNWALSNV